MELRHATEPLHIDGWDVYTRQEGYRAVCQRDRSLVVEHLDWTALTLACAAISRPRDIEPRDAEPPLTRSWPHPGAGGGINA